MSRIPLPATVQDAPAAAQPGLEAVHKKLGVVPNMFRLIATSPANRSGASNDPKTDAAIRFATKVARARGHVSEDELNAVKAVGWNDAQVVEIVQHVALNVWTNYFSEVFKTDIDFPVMMPREAD